MRNVPELALVFCPYFSLRSPHLGLARIYTALRCSGHEVDVFDLDSWLKTMDRAWYFEFQKANNIGREFDRVTYLLGLEVMLYTLFYEQHPRFDWADLLESSKVPYVEGLENYVELAVDMVSAKSYDFVLFSTYISNLLFSIAVARLVKRRLGCKVIFGGPGCGLPETAEFLLNTGFVDAVAIGEGEGIVNELVRNWPSDASAPKIPGVASLSGGQMTFTPAPMQEDLDLLPRTVFPEDDGSGGYVPIESSRGCTMNCAFCSESQYWDHHRIRSVGSVLAEIEVHQKSREHIYMDFVDSLVNPSQERLHSLVDGFVHWTPRFEWGCEMRPVPWLGHEMAARLHKSGCRNVNLGAETFIPERLKYLRKATRVDWILATIETLSAAGIQTNVHRMCCLKGETDSEILEMYDLLKHFKRSIKDPNQWARIGWGAPDVLRLEPYSPMFKDPARWGLEISSFELPLPSGLTHLEHSLRKLCVSWSDGMPRREKLRRNALMKRMDRLVGLVS